MKWYIYNHIHIYTYKIIYEINLGKPSHKEGIFRTRIWGWFFNLTHQLMMILGMVYYWLYHSQVLRHDLHKTATRPGYKKLLNMAIEIVDLAMKNGGSFHSFLYVYQRVICSIWMYCDTPHNSRHRALWNWLYPLWAAIFNPPLWWGHLGLPISVITKFVRLVAQIFFTQNGMKNICLPLIAHIYIYI